MCIVAAVAEKKKQQISYAGLVKRFGSQAEAARKLGVPQSTLSGWQQSFPKRTREWVQLKIASL